MPLIEVDNVNFSYRDGVLALEELSLDLEEGSFTCILGGNGSGKSTLAKLMNALLLPSSGSVRVAGLLTSDERNTFAIRSQVGMVFQNPDDQIVATIVADDVAFGPENLGVPTTELPGRVSHALERVGLGGFEQRETTALSGGQKQRVAIAGALAMEPRILILDEASAMLDPRGQRELYKICRKLNEEGLTIVAITHSMDEAALADHVVILEEGHVAASGSPEEVLGNVGFLQSLALDVPFAAKMSELLQTRGVCVPTCLTQAQLVDELHHEMNLTCVDAPSMQVPGNRAPSCEESESGAMAQDGHAPLLSFEDVWFTYLSKRDLKRTAEQNAGAAGAPHWGAGAHDVWALEGINLRVNAGDFLGVAGHTGSGKSTLIQMANGLLQPTRGRVLALGDDLSNKHAMHDACRNVGVVFQYPERQLFAATVADDVAFGPRNLGLGGAEVAERVEEALAQVHLHVGEIGSRNPFTLSGGQQRRVAIAGILAMDPQVLVLDEPAAGLDPQAHMRLIELIRELHDVHGKTIVMVSHDMDDLATCCNRVVILNQGRIFAQGTPAHVFAREEELKGIGLGMPHTSALMSALGMPLCPDRVLSAEELADVITVCAELASCEAGE